jgi:hypothetical protein
VTSPQRNPRPTSPVVVRRRALLAVLTIVLILIGVFLLGNSPPRVAPQAAGRPVTHAPSSAPAPTPTPTASGPGFLAPGSDPSVLPGPILIADKNNNRLLEVDPEGRIIWEFPRSGDLPAGQTFLIPDDAFFTPNGQQIIATEEDDFVISIVDVATHRIVYRYGTPGHAGSGPNELWNPDDALQLPDGSILTADIKNCRLLLIAPGATSPERVFGTAGEACLHQPPARWGSPNGAFPMTNGHYLVTEINGDWVDELSLNGTIYRSIHPPGVAYPSDSNEISPGVYLTADYSSPGQLVIFNQAGAALWRFRPQGADALNHPSLALPLPNGDILCNDDYNDRVIVVDPHTNTIVWQYGQTHVAGSQPGFLNNPDGVDVTPPNSLMITHASTAGLP